MHNAIAHHPLTDAQPIPEQPPPPHWVATPVYCLAWCQVVWNTPLASLGQLSWVCPLPAPAAPPACSLAGQSEKPKSPWPGVNTALQQLKHQHVISALLILIQNIAPYQLLWGNINSVLTGTRTDIHPLFHTIYVMLRLHSVQYILINHHFHLWYIAIMVVMTYIII